MSRRPRDRQHDGMIRVLVADDHPAVRSGLMALLKEMHDVEPVGEAADAYEVLPALQSTRPDVVLLDHRIPGESGVLLCRRITRQTLAPAVAIYSAFARDRLIIPALVAGAGAVLDKGVPARELMLTLHELAAGRRVVPDSTAAEMRAASALLDADDRALLDMRVSGQTVGQVAQALGISPADVDRRIDVILSTLLVGAGETEPASQNF